MSSILDMLGKQLGGGLMGQLSGKLGADQDTTDGASGAALTALLGALQRNASTPEGAASLHKALEKDHDGGMLDDLGGLLGGLGGLGGGNAPSAPSSRAADGDGILRHVLGDKRPTVEARLAKQTGMESGAVGKLLTTLAPMLMGALGKTQRQQKMDPSQLSHFLGQERQQLEQREPQAAGLMGKMLDADGDGDFDMGDMAKHGVGMLGKLFKR